MVSKQSHYPHFAADRIVNPKNLIGKYFMVQFDPSVERHLVGYKVFDEIMNSGLTNDFFIIPSD